MVKIGLEKEQDNRIAKSPKTVFLQADDIVQHDVVGIRGIEEHPAPADTVYDPVQIHTTTARTSMHGQTYVHIHVPCGYN